MPQMRKLQQKPLNGKGGNAKHCSDIPALIDNHDMLTYVPNAKSNEHQAQTARQ